MFLLAPLTSGYGVPIARYHRHARDYERNTDTSEAMIYIAMISLMSRRLARKNYS